MIPLITVGYFATSEAPLPLCSDCANEMAWSAEWIDIGPLVKHGVQTFTFEQVDEMPHDLYRACHVCHVGFECRPASTLPAYGMADGIEELRRNVVGRIEWIDKYLAGEFDPPEEAK